MRKAVRFRTKQGQHQPHFHSMTVQRSSTVMKSSIGFSLVGPFLSSNTMEWILKGMLGHFSLCCTDKGLKLTLRWANV